jgi:tRNA A37 threonylcarbamoyladenosine biosynthesis protein TsaE
VHVDAYRLAGAPEAAWLGLELIFDPDKVTVVEWAERFGDLLPAESLSVRLEFVSTKRRRIRIDDAGEKAVNAIAEAKAAVARLPASGKSEDGGSAQETGDVSGD